MRCFTACRRSSSDVVSTTPACTPAALADGSTLAGRNDGSSLQHDDAAAALGLGAQRCGGVQPHDPTRGLLPSASASKARFTTRWLGLGLGLRLGLVGFGLG